MGLARASIINIKISFLYGGEDVATLLAMEEDIVDYTVDLLEVGGSGQACFHSRLGLLRAREGGTWRGQIH